MKQNVRFVYLEYDEYISQLIFRQKRKDDKKIVYIQIDDEWHEPKWYFVVSTIIMAF